MMLNEGSVEKVLKKDAENREHLLQEVCEWVRNCARTAVQGSGVEVPLV